MSNNKEINESGEEIFYECEDKDGFEEKTGRANQIREPSDRRRPRLAPRT